MLRFAISALCLAVLSQASLMGIDLGSEFIKIATVKGNSSIDVVLNEQSRRKTYNFIGFRETDRFIGDDARNLAARFPANFFPMVSKLAGVPFDDERRSYYTDALHIPIDLVRNDKRGTIDIKCFRDPATTYSADELLAMLIEFCRETTRKDAGFKPTEAVITIPHTYDMWQRNALVQASQMVGVRVTGLMHSTTAAALRFGIQNRGFGNETIYIAVFDMGSVAAEVGIYKIRPTEPPKEGRMRLAVSLGTIETLAIESEENLGGRMFDACLAEMIQDEFVQKGIPEVLSGKTLQQRKSVFSLMRAANKAREILSANQHTPLTVEGVAPDRDFQTVITRTAFEQRCDHLFKKVVSLADKAIKSAGIEPKDLKNFEMMGGAGRMPRMITDMSEFMGRMVDRTLNSDESGAMGAVYQAAQHSAHIRIKSFAVQDFVPEKITFDILKADGSGYTTPRVLFDNAPLGMKKSLTLNRTSDIIIRFFVGKEGAQKHFSTVNVSGVRDAMTLLGATDEILIPAESNKNAFAVRVEVRLTNAGVIQVEDAEARFRYAFNKTKKVKVSVNTSLDNQSDVTSADEVKFENKTIETTKRKTAPLTTSSSVMKPLLMDSEDIAAAKSVLQSIEKIEKLKRATATSKNDLETYIQWLKYDGVLGNDELREMGIISSDDEESLRTLVKDTQEWLEDGEGSEPTCTIESFVEKMNQLKKVADPYWSSYLTAKNPPPTKEEALPEEGAKTNVDQKAKVEKPKQKKGAKTKGKAKASEKAKSKSKSNSAPEEL